MGDILHTFGVDWRLIGIQVFNFGLLLALLSYFLYRPILRVIDERRKTIEQGLRDSALAKEKLAAAEAERAALVKQAHDEASGIALRAKEHAEEHAAAIIGDARIKGARIVEEAKKEGLLAKDRLYKETETEIAKTALLAAEKILKNRS